jgi:basic membrane protein A|tara:strand:+ start:16092 stop:17201 length:1110 start_codon:yes stop_codon:yes gene_type:complete
MEILMSKKFIGGLLLAILVGLAFYYQAIKGEDVVIDDGVTKVGFIYIGPIGDMGWSYEHDKARLAVEAEFGDQVETTYVESVPESQDAERVITELAQDHDLIFTTSFGYMNPTLKVAEAFPNVKFEHATGYKRNDNTSIYSARFYEGRHLIGLIAGGMTKTNTIGYIASFPIPEVVRGINAAYLAAISVNPTVEFKVIWLNTWFDPGKEADAAKALIDQGADVIMQHTDSPAAMTVAEQEGVYAFGQASDMIAYGPNAQLTSIIDNWAPYYILRTKDIIDGTWKSTDTWGGIDSGMVELAKISDKVPTVIKNLVEQANEGIVNGTLHPFTGPINKQDGSVWLVEGEVASDGDLLGMAFYVEGIDGMLPN